VVAEARAVRSGRTIAFIQVEVHDAAGKHVATGRVTYLILRPR
jgi:acyl-coenzyme A thioesterase PaaI-like protein